MVREPVAHYLLPSNLAMIQETWSSTSFSAISVGCCTYNARIWKRNRDYPTRFLHCTALPGSKDSPRDYATGKAGYSGLNLADEIQREQAPSSNSILKSL